VRIQNTIMGSVERWAGWDVVERRLWLKLDALF
jgi:hypothetical protein